MLDTTISVRKVQSIRKTRHEPSENIHRTFERLVDLSFESSQNGLSFDYTRV